VAADAEDVEPTEARRQAGALLVVAVAAVAMTVAYGCFGRGTHRLVAMLVVIVVAGAVHLVVRRLTGSTTARFVRRPAPATRLTHVAHRAVLGVLLLMGLVWGAADRALSGLVAFWVPAGVVCALPAAVAGWWALRQASVKRSS
jgi:hypothetical protein